MKATYTSAAKLELEAFQKRQRDLLEKIVIERKRVYGDEELEITASDIKSASENFHVNKPRVKRNFLNEIVMRAYIVIGIAMMLSAIFHAQLIELYYSNKPQAVLFFTGAGMALTGWIFNQWISARRAQEAEIIKEHLDFINNFKGDEIFDVEKINIKL